MQICASRGIQDFKTRRVPNRQLPRGVGGSGHPGAICSDWPRSQVPPPQAWCSGPYPHTLLEVTVPLDPTSPKAHLGDKGLDPRDNRSLVSLDVSHIYPVASPSHSKPSTTSFLTQESQALYTHPSGHPDNSMQATS